MVRYASTHRLARPALVVLALLLLMASGATARTWHVGPDSTGSASVIHAALDSASYGDTVLVGPGTYMKTDDPETWIQLKAGVALVGKQGAEATDIVICGVPIGIFLMDCEGARVSGFRVWRPDVPDCDIPMGGISGINVVECTDVVVENCILEDISVGIETWGESSEWWKPVIRDNVIRNCNTGIMCYEVYHPGRPYFVGNTITDCRLGVEVWNSEPNFEDCEITYCRDAGMAYGGHCGGNVKRSVIAHNEEYGIYVGSDPPIASPTFNGSWLPELANDIYDNGSWDIFYDHTGADAPLMAIYNCWRAECPEFATRVYGTVMYSPWMDSTHTRLIYTVDCETATEPSTWGSIKAMFR
ncbi:MAG: right-handed parallel beta-helix repeat-containing protein [Candidatus Eisenbacteria bacterium]